MSSVGVSDGARTRDNRSHNPVLYLLSYTHRNEDAECTCKRLRCKAGSRRAGCARSALAARQREAVESTRPFW